MRRSGPSTFSPEGSVTVTVIGLGGDPPRPRPPPPRPPPAPPVSQWFCSIFPSGSRVPMPCRSPVGEWQPLHLAAKYFCARTGDPQRAHSGGGVLLSGGAP